MITLFMHFSLENYSRFVIYFVCPGSQCQLEFFLPGSFIWKAVVVSIDGSNMFWLYLVICLVISVHFSAFATLIS